MKILYAPTGMGEEVRARLAEDTKQIMLYQNQYESRNGHIVRGAYSDAYEVVRKIDLDNQRAGYEASGFCLDMGVLTLCKQNPYEFVRELGSRLKAVILRENDGVHDISLLPFSYTQGSASLADWGSLMRGLREIDFDGVLILEYENSMRVHSAWLRPAVEEMACKVGEYFLWQLEVERVMQRYSQRVLFGAGNMFRNYMKYYGEEYPPLFTCDNNQALWGQCIDGIEVREPQALCELPKGCAIVICNMHYHEIEKQLLELGVKNPIEKYSDEYLPYK